MDGFSWTMLYDFAGPAVLALAVLAAISVLRSSDVDGGSRLGWILAVVALPVLGPLAWFVVGRRSARKLIART